MGEPITLLSTHGNNALYHIYHQYHEVIPLANHKDNYQEQRLVFKQCRAREACLSGLP